MGERTVFRNYATRIDLLLATAAWIERSVLPRHESPSIFDMPLTVRAALAHLDSAATWVTFRREFGMSRRDISDAAAWAAEAVLDPIRFRVG